LRIPLGSILLPLMIRPGFLDDASRRDLIDLTRDGAAAHRLGRRANALVLLDDGLSCEAVGKVLYLDGDTIREWHKLYLEDGTEGLAAFNHEGGSCRLTAEQQDKLKAWIGETLPRTTRQIGAWIAHEFGIDYQSRSGLIALLHRLGMEHRKPRAISRKLDPAKQKAFIEAYDALLNQLSVDEAVVFADAVHPTHAVRPVGCWAPKEIAVAVEQSSGRDRLNIHGAIDLETGRTIVKDVLSVDALSTILLLTSIETLYPGMRFIHVFLDNARYHHAKLVQAWLARPGCRIRLHFVPTYCPHLNPIERLWGLMHRHTTHNKCYATFKEFSVAMLTFLREEVPANWREWCDEVTDNFRVINPKEFRIIG
jgi:transposase